MRPLQDSWRVRTHEPIMVRRAPLLTLAFAAVLTAVLTACSPSAPRSGRVSGGPSYALQFGHVGVGVSDLDASARWYRDAFGFVPVSDVYDITVDASPLGRVAGALFGPEQKRLRILQLQSPQGVSLELFEFVDPVAHRPAERPRTGLLHLALVAPDFDAALFRLEQMGAHRIVLNDANPSRRTAFFSDPDGNVVEIASHDWGGG